MYAISMKNTCRPQSLSKLMLISLRTIYTICGWQQLKFLNDVRNSLAHGLANWQSINHQMAAGNENQHSIEIVFTHTTLSTFSYLIHIYIWMHAVYILGRNQRTKRKSCSHSIGEMRMYENTCRFKIFHISHFAFRVVVENFIQNNHMAVNLIYCWCTTLCKMHTS